MSRALIGHLKIEVEIIRLGTLTFAVHVLVPLMRAASPIKHLIELSVGRDCGPMRVGYRPRGGKITQRRFLHPLVDVGLLRQSPWPGRISFRDPTFQPVRIAAADAPVRPPRRLHHPPPPIVGRARRPCRRHEAGDRL